MLSAFSLAIQRMCSELPIESIPAAIWLLSSTTFFLVSVKLFIRYGAYYRIVGYECFLYFGPAAETKELQQLQWNTNTWSDDRVLAW
jgi:hypothetical protein